jgi:hypothetical protein
MKYFLALTMLAFGSVPAHAQDSKTDWKEFTSKEGHFKVLMPGKPEHNNLDSVSDFGKGILHMNSAQANGTMYAGNYSDFPEGIKKVPIKQVFDSSRDGAVGNLDGKLVSEKDIELNKHPGREILIAVAGGVRLFRVRVYLVDRRLYQVVVFGPKEAANSKEADKFLDSFKLTEK